MDTRLRSPNAQAGFTLVELIIVIVLMGVVFSMVAVFMKSPIDAYLASGRRAALTDTADTVLRRIGRDIRRAVPNTVRQGTSCVEFVPAKTGGRYRTDELVAGDGLNLDFAITDSSFNMLGSNAALPAAQRISQGDLIVVYNLGITGSDVYDTTNANGGKNWVAVAAVPSESGSPLETTISIAPGFKFPLASGSNRFQVVDANEKMVAYVCSGGSSGTLFRTVNTAITSTASCATSTAGTATASILASNVDCTNTALTYSGSDLQRNALVNMKLTLKDSSGNESVTLQSEVHIGNTP